MHKMIFELDEKKIEAENQYNLDDIYSYIEKVCNRCKLAAVSKNEYIGDCAGVAGIVMLLSDTQWFMDNVLMWEWWYNDRYSDKNTFEKEDIIQNLKDYYKNNAQLECGA